MLVLCMSFKSLTAVVLAWVPGRCTRAVPSTARASAAPNGTYPQTILLCKHIHEHALEGSDRFCRLGRRENLGQTHSGAAAGKSKHGAGQYTLEIRGILLPVRNQPTQPCRLAVIEAWPSPRASVLSALSVLCTCVACLLGSG